MNELFKKYLPHTLQFEGGYVWDRDDAGGETFRGVARASNPNWGGWKLIDSAKKLGLKTASKIDAYFKDNQEMFDLVAEIYERDYFNPVAKLGAPDRVLVKVFDTGVNCGPRAAIKMAQQVLGAGADGVIGPNTLKAVESYFNSKSEDDFLDRFCIVQENYYRAIVKRKPSQAKFLKGWLRRAAWKPE